MGDTISVQCRDNGDYNDEECCCCAVNDGAPQYTSQKEACSISHYCAKCAPSTTRDPVQIRSHAGFDDWVPTPLVLKRGMIVTTFRDASVSIPEATFFHSDTFKIAYEHQIAAVFNLGKKLRIKDGIGKEFLVTWRWFLKHVNAAHKWSGDDLDEIFLDGRVRFDDPISQLKYVDDEYIYAMNRDELKSVRDFTFFHHSALRIAYRHTIVSVDEERRTVTIEDGVTKQNGEQNSFNLGWDAILEHTRKEHKWVGDDFPQLFAPT